MFSMAPNIVLVPNMTQNAERKHRTQDTNTAPIRPQARRVTYFEWSRTTRKLKVGLDPTDDVTQR